MKKKEQLEFLMSLQKEMKNQEVDCQASPRFWVVRDYKKKPCWEGNVEEWVVYSPDSCKSYSNNIEVMQEIIKDYSVPDEAIEKWKSGTKLFSNCEGGYEDERDFLDWFKKYVDEEAYLVPLHEVAEIKEGTFFLTKRECEEHIERNKHNYSSKVHTYAMTAWCSPQVETLWGILEDFDFRDLSNT